MSVLPDFDSLIPVATGTAGTFDISLRLRDDDFAFRFTGYVDVPSDGSWTFYTSSDDGSELFIDGGQVVFNDGLHGNQEQAGILSLTAGYHAIVVTMFERGGNEVLNVSWEGPGVSKQAISSGVLFREIPSPIVNDPPALTSPGDQYDIVDGDIAIDFSLTASDPDGDPLFFDSASLPLGLGLDSDTGQISGTLSAASVGNYEVTLSVSDGPDIDAEEIVWVVPEPSGPWLWIAGITGLFALGRRRR